MAGGKSRRIIIRPRADRDVTELARYIAEDNAEAALRFYDAAEASFNQLARMPHLGPARKYRNPRLRGLRMWPVTGFRNYLIFYRPITGGIEIIRVLRGEQDITSILEEE